MRLVGQRGKIPANAFSFGATKTRPTRAYVATPVRRLRDAYRNFFPPSRLPPSKDGLASDRNLRIITVPNAATDAFKHRRSETIFPRKNSTR